MAGYPMESRDHVGKIIEYHMATELSWAVRLTNHPLATVIDSVLLKRWPAGEKAGREVPDFKRQDGCVFRGNSGILRYRIF